MSISRTAAFVPDAIQIWATLTAATHASFKLSTAYMINVIRWPLVPLVLFASSYIAYQIAGRETIDGVDAAGFLLVGMFGYVVTSSAVWWSGSAIDQERSEGTIAALFLSPASRIAVIAGYGIAGFIVLLPSIAALLVLGLVVGASLNIASPTAVVAATTVLLVSSLSLGFVLAAFFVLSRRANLMANVIQNPLYLLGGFIVPRDELPGGLRALSDALPIAHAVDAFRSSTLAAGSLSETAPELAAALISSAVFTMIGGLGIRRIERVAKRSGQLDLF